MTYRPLASTSKPVVLWRLVVLVTAPTTRGATGFEMSTAATALAALPETYAKLPRTRTRYAPRSDAFVLFTKPTMCGDKGSCTSTTASRPKPLP